MRIEFIVNGKTERLDVPGGKRLLDVLREDLHLTGAKEGCGEGECGACTVLMDGEAVHSCMVLAGQLTGHTVTTIEGLEQDGRLGVLQNAFVEQGAVQCGYCTPGMIMSAAGLLNRTPDPTEEEIRVALSGNICRCSGYVQIVAAVKAAAEILRQEGKR
ncbi:(2Fe-2S)-binding protein [Dysosmobacter sp.]|uniref:(2Fe-2S)-binding protein n=1 Tax=Dysosmobacter sp. TaxID=2591382 RepID=UPI002A8B182E|nr:(2Fe-2S)-binding protein [Dysosmobacter sp.]MDY3282349.1 (2Fe-2S)-binding protein [Dysosmobacter sp.]